MTWNRRQFLARSSAAFSALLLPTAGFASLFTSEQPEPSFTPLRGDLGIFNMSGGTILYYLTDDAFVMVDSQFPQSAQVCLDGLRKESQRKIDYLINTHHHGDHTGGNGVLKEHTKVILAHANVTENLKAAATAERPAPPGPTETYTSEKHTVKAGAETISLYYQGRAHTSGDSVVHFENANIAHMGDLVFNRSHPYIDRPRGAHLANWVTVMEKTVARLDKDTLYIFGHGSGGVQGTADDLTYFGNYINEVLTQTKKAVDAGMDLTEATETVKLNGFDDVQNLGRRLNLGFVVAQAYGELTDS